MKIAVYHVLPKTQADKFKVYKTLQQAFDEKMEAVADGKDVVILKEMTEKNLRKCRRDDAQVEAVPEAVPVDEAPNEAQLNLEIA